MNKLSETQSSQMAQDRLAPAAQRALISAFSDSVPLSASENHAYDLMHALRALAPQERGDLILWLASLDVSA